ncbi:MAG: D-glycero-beta-D-manno-heptose 1-phosphate adenylyltransferase [Candidatus Omnitrophica bacterium]|nr:D-glycero-beta-D-manno-heptose 1-phosphate adenylyltransferase [Candidatus Omnitrophota bacterium]
MHSAASLAPIVRRLQRRGRRVVFANGCFDLLHVGHVTLLERARRLGDALIVALNSDRSVRRLKGPGRPVVRQQDRARLLAALACVDYVTMFDEPTPHRLLARLRPDVLVKGADWSLRDVVGRDLVKRVVRIALVNGYSTTDLLARLASRRQKRGVRPL